MKRACEALQPRPPHSLYKRDRLFSLLQILLAFLALLSRSYSVTPSWVFYFQSKGRFYLHMPHWCFPSIQYEERAGLSAET